MVNRFMMIHRFVYLVIDWFTTINRFMLVHLRPMVVGLGLQNVGIKGRGS